MRTKIKHAVRNKHFISKMKMVVGLFFLFSFFFSTSLMGYTRGAYTESVSIDLKLDSGYEKVYESENYTVYYANSESYNFILINFSFDIIGKQIEISSGAFSYDLTPFEVQTNFLHSLHDNVTLELKVSRSSVGDSFTLTLDDLHLNLVFTAQGTPPPPSVDNEDDEEKDDEKEDKEEEEQTLDPMGWIEDSLEWFQINAWWISSLFSFLFALFVIYVWRFLVKPIIYIRDPQGEDLKLGRFVDCYKADPPLNRLWIHVYKTRKDGIKKYYSHYTFEYMRGNGWMETSKIPPFEKYMGHVIPIKTQLSPGERPPEMTWQKKKLVEKEINEQTEIIDDKGKSEIKTKKEVTRKKRIYFGNYFRYAFYKIISFFIPLGWTSYKAKDIVKMEQVKDENGELVFTEEITMLVHEATMEHFTTVKDIEYDRITYESGKKEVKHVPLEKAVPIYRIEAIKKDGNYVEGSMKEGEPYLAITHYDTAEEAMKKIWSKAELQGIHEIQKQKLFNEIDEKNKELLDNQNAISNLKSKIKAMVVEAIKKRENQSVATLENLPDILAEVFMLEELSGDSAKAMERSFDNYLQRISPKRITKLEARVEEQSETIKVYKTLLTKGNGGTTRGNTITIKNEED